MGVGASAGASAGFSKGWASVERDKDMEHLGRVKVSVRVKGDG